MSDELTGRCSRPVRHASQPERSEAHFCTYFDRNYLVRGVTLYRSLVRHCGQFRLYVLCLDSFSYEAVLKLSLQHVVPIYIGELEAADQQLLAAKADRSAIEYYFTCTAPLMLYLIRRFPEIEVITYLDSDLFFFADPQPIFAEMDGRSVLIVEHRFPPHLAHLNLWGRYNVGLLATRVDESGLACLRWWRERCLEWCFDRLEGNRYADQKYLDEWPSRFEGVGTLQHKGAGLAPWNVAGYTLSERDGAVFVDSEPLIYYHFHALRVFSPYVFEARVEDYQVTMAGALAKGVYRPYLRQLQAEMRRAHVAACGTVRGLAAPTGRDVLRTLVRRRAFVVVGPFWANLYLEPVAAPLLRWFHAGRSALMAGQVAHHG